MRILLLFFMVFFVSANAYAVCPDNAVSTAIGDEVCPDQVVPLNIETLIGVGELDFVPGGGLSTGGTPIFDLGSTAGGADALARAQYANDKVEAGYALLASETCPASMQNTDGSPVVLDSDEKNIIRQAYVDFLIDIDFTDQIVNGTFANQAAFDAMVDAMIADAISESLDALNQTCQQKAI